MARWTVLVAGAIALTGAAFVAGASGPPVVPVLPAPVVPVKAEVAKPPAVKSQKNAVFNMAVVMREFNLAKYQVWLLNNKKLEMSKNLSELRSKHSTAQTVLKENPNHPDKDEISQTIRELSRKIEDEDRDLNKSLNDAASVIIGELYDKMMAVVRKMAEMNGYQIVFSYPDAVTPIEAQSLNIKELKLKPPAAQPFHIAPRADITKVVVMTLNAWFPPIDSKSGDPVDISKLDTPQSDLVKPASDQPLFVPPSQPIKLKPPAAAPSQLPPAVPAPKQLKIPAAPSPMPPAP